MAGRPLSRGVTREARLTPAHEPSALKGEPQRTSTAWWKVPRFWNG